MLNGLKNILSFLFGQATVRFELDFHRKHFVEILLLYLFLLSTNWFLIKISSSYVNCVLCIVFQFVGSFVPNESTFHRYKKRMGLALSIRLNILVSVFYTHETENVWCEERLCVILDFNRSLRK